MQWLRLVVCLLVFGCGISTHAGEIPYPQTKTTTTFTTPYDVSKLASIITIHDSGARSRWIYTILEHANNAGVSPTMLANLIRQESQYDSLAVNRADPSYGAAQVMPRYWQGRFVQECGSNGESDELLQLDIGVCYGAHILAYSIKLCGNDVARGLGRYNSGRCVVNAYARSVLLE